MSADMDASQQELDRVGGQFDQLVAAYRSSGESVCVNFRELVPFNSGVDRYTHLLHPYPAKLLLNIPYFFLRCPQLAPRNASVLDPFCGSGTVLLEAMLSGRSAVGADSNPLARLIATTKITPISRRRLDAGIASFLAAANSIGEHDAPDVINIKHWFYPSTIRDLTKLAVALKSVGAPDVRNFLSVCFSATVRKVSLADPRNSVPVRINKEYAATLHAGGALGSRLRNVFKTFSQVAETNARRIVRLNERLGNVKEASAIHVDARSLWGQRRKPYVDLIITSPPYTGAQKYVRASSLSLGWLGLAKSDQIRPLERLNIGREHYSANEVLDQRSPPVRSATETIAKAAAINPLRAHIASNYLWEMKDALIEAYEVLRPGGNLVLVAGANLVCGYQFDTPSYLHQLARGAGFKTTAVLSDDIRSRGLMTKRNRTAGIIDTETVMILRKSQ